MYNQNVNGVRRNVLEGTAVELFRVFRSGASFA
jgi:hypothetical protein